jgi:hypothetical protein
MIIELYKSEMDKSYIISVSGKILPKVYEYTYVFAKTIAI